MNRRGFLKLLTGAAAGAVVAPRVSYFFAPKGGWSITPGEALYLLDRPRVYLWNLGQPRCCPVLGVTAAQYEQIRRIWNAGGSVRSIIEIGSLEGGTAVATNMVDLERDLTLVLDSEDMLESARSAGVVLDMPDNVTYFRGCN